MDTIVVAAATAMEISLLVRMMGARGSMVQGPRETYEGECRGKRIILAITGMGKVNTASALTDLIGRFSPKLLINTGCAGAYVGSALSIGDLAIATAEIYGDEGVFTPSGWKPLDCIGIPLFKTKEKIYFNELPFSDSLVEKAVRFAEEHGIPLRKGKFVTVSSCSGTAVRGEELSNRFEAICENMEGAAAAHVSIMYEIDFMEIRGISNVVEDRDLSRWDIARAAENAQRFIHAFIESF
jgi:futalosine hydrolase